MIFMYHNIAEKSGFNTVAVSELRKQLLYLKNNFELVTIDFYIRNLPNRKNIALISVDDAYLSFKEFFYPLLKEFNIPAILFVPVDHVGKSNVWDSEKIIDIMNWEDIKLISDENLVTIGSHGKSHKHLSKQTKTEIISEFSDSKATLEQQISKPIKHFSYPFGQINDYNSFAIDCLMKFGYKSACSTRYGISNSKKDISALKRIEIEPDDNLSSFKEKCKNRLHKKLLKRFIKEILFKIGFIK
jgi:peptidoglycan/xylan/chitin deacetylase (PgdA/CDA1 family)